MLPIRNGSSFHYCNKGSEASLSAISQQNTILSEKAKSFSIFLQITEVLQMEIGAQKRDEAKSTLLHLFYMISYSVSYCIS